jgi:hypothetical protein
MTGKHLIVLLAVAGLAIIAVFIAIHICTPAFHPAIGNWRSGFISLIVYPDKIATFNGFECDWTPVDEATIRIDPKGKIEIPWLNITLDVAFNFHVLEGGSQATLDLLGFPVTLDKDGGTTPAP